MPAPRPYPPHLTGEETDTHRQAPALRLRLRPHPIRQRFWTTYTVLMGGVFVPVLALLFAIEPPSRTGLLLSAPLLCLLLGHGVGSLLFYTAHESIHLRGRELTVRRTLGPLCRRTRYRLGPRSRPCLTRRWDGLRTEVRIRDCRNRIVRLARGATDAQQYALAQRLGASLEEHGAKQAAPPSGPAGSLRFG